MTSHVAARVEPPAVSGLVLSLALGCGCGEPAPSPQEMELQAWSQRYAEASEAEARALAANVTAAERLGETVPPLPTSLLAAVRLSTLPAPPASQDWPGFKDGARLCADLTSALAMPAADEFEREKRTSRLEASWPACRSALGEWVTGTLASEPVWRVSVPATIRGEYDFANHVFDFCPREEASADRLDEGLVVAVGDGVARIANPSVGPDGWADCGSETRFGFRLHVSEEEGKPLRRQADAGSISLELAVGPPFSFEVGDIVLQRTREVGVPGLPYRQAVSEEALPTISGAGIAVRVADSRGRGLTPWAPLGSPSAWARQKGTPTDPAPPEPSEAGVGK